MYGRAKNDFQNRKLEAEHSESTRKLKEMHDLTLGKEKDVFEKQRMVCMYVCMYECVCMHIYVCMYVCMYVCSCFDFLWSNICVQMYV